MLFAGPPLAAVIEVVVVFADSVCANVPFNRVGAAANAATYMAIARIFGPVPLEIFINVLEATDIFKYYLIRLSSVRFYRFAITQRRTYYIITISKYIQTD
jgi:hypothetical protein